MKEKYKKYLNFIFLNKHEHEKSIYKINYFNCICNSFTASCINNEKYEDSIAELNLSIEINPEDAEAYYYRGLINFIFKKYSESITDWNNALNLKSERGDEIRVNIKEAEKKL